MKAVLADYLRNPFELLRRRSVSAAGGYASLESEQLQRNGNAANGLNAQYKKKWRSSISPMSTGEDDMGIATGGYADGVKGYYYKFCGGHARILVAAVIAFLLTGGLIGLVRRRSNGNGFFDSGLNPPEPHIPNMDWDLSRNPKYPWMDYPMLSGFYSGVRNLVPWSQWTPEELQADTMHLDKREEPVLTTSSSSRIPLPLERYSPYPDYEAKDYLAEYAPVEQCFLDEDEKMSAPDAFAYPGIPQQMSMPLFGSYHELGLRHDVCFERFGRFGPYGYGYSRAEGGLGVGSRSEHEGSEDLWRQQPKIDYRNVNWGKAQKRCYEKNRARFSSAEEKSVVGRLFGGTEKKKVPRTAYVLRAWTGFRYTEREIITLRAMINELALRSGGEYDVHILLHSKDDDLPIWASKKVYQQVIQDNIPEEFWDITTLWSVPLMKMYYPGRFDDVFDNPSLEDPHGVYRAAHLAIQWFGAEFPDYDFVWNWEMDMRYTGQLYEFHEGVAKWAKQQPRKGLWERNSRFWIPEKHGNYSDFLHHVDQETMTNGEIPVWGPASFPNNGMIEPIDNVTPPHSWFEDNFEWGIGEEADLITFNPIFDPAKTNWVFRADLTGYDLNLPIPPRRCAIITVARYSRRMIDAMHDETYQLKHSAFPEMWPPTVALHQGLKAVYIPHPIYFDRQWPLDVLDNTFNYPETAVNSPFGWGEHNLLGSSFYYNAVFSGKLWRRWWGEVEDHEGGIRHETEGSGRMCLRSTLHHPIKSEESPEDEVGAL